MKCFFCKLGLFLLCNSDEPVTPKTTINNLYPSEKPFWLNQSTRWNQQFTHDEIKNWICQTTRSVFFVLQFSLSGIKLSPISKRGCPRLSLDFNSQPGSNCEFCLFTLVSLLYLITLWLIFGVHRCWLIYWYSHCCKSVLLIPWVSLLILKTGLI